MQVQHVVVAGPIDVRPSIGIVSNARRVWLLCQRRGQRTDLLDGMVRLLHQQLDLGLRPIEQIGQRLPPAGIADPVASPRWARARIARSSPGLSVAAEGTARREIGVPNSNDNSGEIGTKATLNPIWCAKPQQN
jgi:hypothetical protein